MLMGMNMLFKTLKVLHSVDPVIVGTYYSQSVQAMPLALPINAKNEYVSRLLEIVEMQYADDVEQYAKQVKDLFAVVEGEDQGRTEGLPVLESSVERILNQVKQSKYHSIHNPD